MDTYASLRIPEFRYFVMNSFLITATLLIQEVTLGYELYKMTHDPLMLGLVGLAEAIPFIALSLFGGHLADRRDKNVFCNGVCWLFCSAQLFCIWFFSRLLWSGCRKRHG